MCIRDRDKVESGKADWRKTVDDFYQGFEASLEQAEKNMEGKKVKVPDEPSIIEPEPHYNNHSP